MVNEAARRKGLAKIQKRQRAVAMQNRERIRQAWEDGISRKDLCQKVGLSEKVVSQHVQALGLRFSNGRKSKNTLDLDSAMKLATMRW